MGNSWEILWGIAHIQGVAIRRVMPSKSYLLSTGCFNTEKKVKERLNKCLP